MVGKITGEIRGYTAAVLVSDSNVTHWAMLCKTEARQVAKGNTKKRIALVQLKKNACSLVSLSFVTSQSWPK